MSSWGLGSKFSKSPLVGEFSIFGSKSKVFQKHYRSQAFFSKVGDFSILWSKSSFSGRLGTYNVPAGPSANPCGEARSAEFDGVGLDGVSKVSFKNLPTLWIDSHCSMIEG